VRVSALVFVIFLLL